jgi:hypothetical protein
MLKKRPELLKEDLDRCGFDSTVFQAYLMFSSEVNEALAPEIRQHLFEILGRVQHCGSFFRAGLVRLLPFCTRNPAEHALNLLTDTSVMVREAAAEVLLPLPAARTAGAAQKISAALLREVACRETASIAHLSKYLRILYESDLSAEETAGLEQLIAMPHLNLRALADLAQAGSPIVASTLQGRRLQQSEYRQAATLLFQMAEKNLAEVGRLLTRVVRGREQEPAWALFLAQSVGAPLLLRHPQETADFIVNLSRDRSPAVSEVLLRFLHHLPQVQRWERRELWSLSISEQDFAAEQYFIEAVGGPGKLLKLACKCFTSLTDKQLRDPANRIALQALFRSVVGSDPEVALACAKRVLLEKFHPELHRAVLYASGALAGSPCAEEMLDILNRLLKDKPALSNHVRSVRFALAARHRPKAILPEVARVWGMEGKWLEQALLFMTYPGAFSGNISEDLVEQVKSGQGEIREVAAMAAGEVLRVGDLERLTTVLPEANEVREVIEACLLGRMAGKTLSSQERLLMLSETMLRYSLERRAALASRSSETATIEDHEHPGSIQYATGDRCFADTRIFVLPIAYISHHSSLPLVALNEAWRARHDDKGTILVMSVEDELWRELLATRLPWEQELIEVALRWP